MSAWPFREGRLYSRKNDIHSRFGGQERGGISTPQAAPVIFLFTGDAGVKHGYADTWNADGTFHYTGEGQTGDMVLKRGNLAVATHAGRSKDLLLFETTGKGQPVRYRGQFVCVGWFTTNAPDTVGGNRASIVFKLVPLETAVDGVEGSPPETAGSPDEFARLRAKAFAANAQLTAKFESHSPSSYFIRSKAVRDYALARADGRCERCKSTAPFRTAYGTPFLEVHHIKRLSDGGLDSPDAVAAICPNCHREAHYGASSAPLNDDLLAQIARRENIISAQGALPKTLDEVGQ